MITFGSFICSSLAIDPLLIGLPLLRYADPTLTGSGVKIAQVEGSESVDGLRWQVNPSATFVSQPTNLFTYYSSLGSSSAYTNTFGLESGHANGVGGNFYGSSIGVAPGVQHVDNYEANYFYNSIITPLMPPAIAGKIVNQSFVFSGLTTAQQQTVDNKYDSYAVQYNTLFVSGVGGAGTGGRPNAPSTAYNGIGVGAFGGDSSVGSTLDNGRSKPDITAPDGATSFSTPLVSGAAAILLQAGLRGDAGTGSVTNAAADIRTIKALLLNGAVKPSNWTHTAIAPLDTRFGSGILNVFNSYKQLSAGKYPFIESTVVTEGAPHPPGAATGNASSPTGWDFNSIASTIMQDRVNHYYFNLPAATAKEFTLTTTLVWNRTAGAAAKHLDLFLYNTSNNTLIASSVSTVDNVEHLFVPTLPAGRYDLQVLKKGGVGSNGTESYALAFESFALSLTIQKSDTNIVVSWPLAPTGFQLQSTTTLNPPVSWTTVPNATVFTNNQNQVTLPPIETAQFFRLVRP